MTKRSGTSVVGTAVVGAPPARVWRALTDPAEVQAWDGSVPLAIPVGYPQAGQRARWRTRLGPVPVTLFDHVRFVEPDRRLAATVRFGFVTVDEEYRLGPSADGGTVVVSDNTVTSRLPGLDRVAAGIVRRSTRAAMANLASHLTKESGTT
ncbi:MAG: SRPBCC family protein [Acidimicrobiales bacterium]